MPANTASGAEHDQPVLAEQHYTAWLITRQTIIGGQGHRHNCQTGNGIGQAPVMRPVHFDRKKKCCRRQMAWHPWCMKGEEACEFHENAISAAILVLLIAHRQGQ